LLSEIISYGINKKSYYNSCNLCEKNFNKPKSQKNLQCSNCEKLLDLLAKYTKIQKDSIMKGIIRCKKSNTLDRYISRFVKNTPTIKDKEKNEIEEMLKVSFGIDL